MKTNLSSTRSNTAEWHACAVSGIAPRALRKQTDEDAEVRHGTGSGRVRISRGGTPFPLFAVVLALFIAALAVPGWFSSRAVASCCGSQGIMVKMCFSWTYNPSWHLGQYKIRFTVGTPGVTSYYPADAGTYLPASGKGCIQVPAGAKVSAEFVDTFNASLEGDDVQITLIQDCCGQGSTGGGKVEIPATTKSGGGNGEGDGGGDVGGEDEPDSEDDCTVGAPASHSPFQFNISLGVGEAGAGAGMLAFNPANLQPASISAGNLSIIATGGTMVNTAGGVTTVSAPKATAVVSALGTGFQVALTKPLNGPSIVTWKFTDAASPGGPEKLKIEEVRGGTTTTQYVTRTATGGWDMETGDIALGGTLHEKLIQHRTTIDGGGVETGGSRYVFKRTAGGALTLVSDLAWSKDAQGRVTMRRVGSATTNYTYQGATRNLDSAIRSDGSWVKYTPLINYDGKVWRMTQRPTKDLTIEQASADPANASSGAVTLERIELAEPLGATIVKSLEDGVLIGTTTSIRLRTGGTVPGEFRDNPVTIPLFQTETTTHPGGAQRISRRCSYPAGAVADFAGKFKFSEEQAGGRKTRSETDYSTWILAGAAVRMETTKEMESSFDSSAGGYHGDPVEQPWRSIRRVRFLGALTNNLLREEDRLVTGAGSDTLLSVREHAYDTDDHLTQSTRDGNVVYDAVWASGRLVAEVDEQGVRTEYSAFDFAGRPLTTTTTGFAGAGANAPVQPDVVATVLYDVEGRKVAEALLNGTVAVVMRVWNYDTGGRMTSESVTGQSLTPVVTSYNHGLTLGGGPMITTTFPGGTTEIASHWRGGGVKAMGGTRAIAEERSGEWQNHALGVLYKSTVTRGNPAGDHVDAHSYTDTQGRVILTEEMNPQTESLSNTLTRQYVYSTVGELAGERLNGLDVLTRTRVTLGFVAVSRRLAASQGTMIEDWEGSYILSMGDGLYQTHYTQRGGTHSQLTGLGGVIAGKGVLTAHSQQFDEGWNITGESFTYVDRANKLVREEFVRPGVASAHVRLTRNGRLESELPPGYTMPWVFSYDVIGRSYSTTDPSNDPNGKTTTTYYDFTYPSKESLVQESNTGGVSSTAYMYHSTWSTSAGLVSYRTFQGQRVDYEYNARGQTTRQMGGNAYPIRYTYNDLGLMKTMTTYHGPKAGGWTYFVTDADIEAGVDVGSSAVTEWIYYPGSTKLASKMDAATRSTGYTYDQYGSLDKRTWARSIGGNPVEADFEHDLFGQIVSVAYNDGTAGCAWSNPDVRGRYQTIADGQGTRTIIRAAIPAGGATWTENIAPQGAAGFASLSLTTTTDTLGRVAGIGGNITLSTGGAGTDLVGQTFTHDPSHGRLSGIADSVTGVAVDYTRVSNSEVIGGTDTKTDGVLRQQMARALDSFGRLGSVTTTRPAGGTLEGRTFAYDSQHRRESDTRHDGSKWDYEYNGRNEVTVASRKATDGGTALNGWQFWYYFDALGNRYFSSGGQRSGYFTTNALNQYTDGTVVGKVEVVGEVTTPDTMVWVRRLDPPPAEVVRVETEAVRQGNWFYRQVAVNENTAGPVDVKIGVKGVQLSTSETREQEGRVLVPSEGEIFTHDEDGNLTGDSLWTYAWDAENRLREAVSKLPPGSASRKKVRFTHDYLNRWVMKEVWKWDAAANMGAGAWVEDYRRHFVWHGWNIIAELEQKRANGAYDTTPATLLRRNVWGLDLSGSLQGAGGVGGLLAVENFPASQLTIPVYDGNGNILAYHDATGGECVADFAYGPFGEPLKANGAGAKNHPFRFSTKYTDEETGIVLYQLRPYRPDLGRWMSKDPIGEEGGVNLYGFVGNNGASSWDILGLEKAAHTYTNCRCVCEAVTDIKLSPPEGGNVRDKLVEFPLKIWLRRKAFRGSSSGLTGVVELQYFETVSDLQGEAAKTLGHKVGVEHDSVVDSQRLKELDRNVKSTMFDDWLHRSCLIPGFEKPFALEDPIRLIVDRDMKLDIRIVITNPDCAVEYGVPITLEKRFSVVYTREAKDAVIVEDQTGKKVQVKKGLARKSMPSPFLSK